MVFSSLPFLFRFLPLVLLLYFSVPKRFRNLVLFLTSLFFYAWGEPIYLFVMLFSITFNYFFGFWVWKAKINEHRCSAKLAVFSSVFVNLALLCFFKYTDFAITNVNHFFGTNLDVLKLALPIGISFYTFQTMSYPIDIYRGDASLQKNYVTFGTYVALFPQLIAGPIVRYKTIEDQLNERTCNFEKVTSGLRRFAAGFGKKVLLANSVGALWTEISAIPADELTVLSAWLGALAFTFQIYFDFSGYSDMAIGLGRIFGFEFLENFNYPYLAHSITDFWRRWHISLSTWFREYLYIPLGGNRRGKLIQIVNLLIVWSLTGFWHGAGWNYIAWGLYFAVILIMEKLFLEKLLRRIPKIFGHIYTLLLVIISWILFAFDGALSSALAFIGAMFSAPLYDDFALYSLLGYGVLFVILAVSSTNLPKKLFDSVDKGLGSRPILRAGLTIFLILFVLTLGVAYLVDGTYNPFLYFQF